MKKRLLPFVLCWLLLSGMSLQAAAAAGTSPLDWEISARPKPTEAEIERERWSYVFTNDIGTYVFDNTSLHRDETDKRVVHVLVKTIFADQKMIAGLNEKYKEKLPAGDHVAISEMQLAFHLRERTYAVIATKVVSEQGTVLEESQQTAKYVPIPSKTFADSMYEIAKNYDQVN